MRAVIVEDLALLREGIVALLRENGIDVVAQAEDGPACERIVAGHKPDLAIVDVRLPPTFTDEGLRAAIEARRRHPGLGVLVLSQYVEPVYTAELLASGEAGVGYLLKERVGDVRAFIEAVQRVADGGTALDREVVAELMRARQAGGDADGALGTLTPREREVLDFMAEGRSNAAVARALVVSGRRRREARAQHLRQARPARQRRRPPPRARGARLRGPGASARRASARSRSARTRGHRRQPPAVGTGARAGSWPMFWHGHLLRKDLDHERTKWVRREREARDRRHHADRRRPPRSDRRSSSCPTRGDTCWTVAPSCAGSGASRSRWCCTCRSPAR